jgi:tetratricopeptide (TPR) repeat protein
VQELESAAEEPMGREISMASPEFAPEFPGIRPGIPRPNIGLLNLNSPEGGGILRVRSAVLLPGRSYGKCRINEGSNLMDKRSSLAVIAVLVLACTCTTTFGQDASSLTLSGRNLTAEEAESLEKQVEKNPSDVSSRTRLLGYYFRKQFQNQSARQAKQKHVLWLIVHSPESEVLGLPNGTLDAILDKEAYSQGKAAWIIQLKESPENLKLLEHSAAFFQLHDRELAIESLQKARTLDMDNPQWPTKLGHLYSLGMMRGSLTAKSNAAGKALEQFEIAYKLSSDMERDALLQSLAKVALAANDPKKAKEYADKMLSQNSPGWNYGNNIHHGNIILGRIALTLDDVEEAKTRLINAGKTPGSPQLNSFGPNMTLAEELLRQGEKDVVLTYLELCSKFWKSGKDRLDKWSVVVQDGEIPDFGANLNY